MEPVRVDFEKKVAEIETFFGHLQDVAVLKASTSTASRRSQAAANKLTELEKILKANVFLLLYNLVESTIRQSLVAICDAVATEALSYSELQENIQLLWIQTKHKNFQNLGAASIFSVLRALPEEVVQLSFEQKLASGGNLDARKIREFAEQYGFSALPHPDSVTSFSETLVSHGLDRCCGFTHWVKLRG